MATINLVSNDFRVSNEPRTRSHPKDFPASYVLLTEEKSTKESSFCDTILMKPFKSHVQLPTKVALSPEIIEIEEEDRPGMIMVKED